MIQNPICKLIINSFQEYYEFPREDYPDIEFMTIDLYANMLDAGYSPKVADEQASAFKYITNRGRPPHVTAVAEAIKYLSKKPAESFDYDQTLPDEDELYDDDYLENYRCEGMCPFNDSLDNNDILQCNPLEKQEKSSTPQHTVEMRPFLAANIRDTLEKTGFQDVIELLDEHYDGFGLGITE